MTKKPQTIDDFLAAVTPAQRVALQKLRQTIRAAAPQAEEGFSYGLPAFRVNGRPLVAFGATANHCGFYPMSPRAQAQFQAELAGFNTSKGTIRFTPEQPLPATLVRKLVKARLAELGAGGKTKPATRNADSEVAAFLRSLKHPLKQEIEEARRVILAASPKIREGIKWNSLSFRTTEWFATLNWRHRAAVQLVFHLGAKVKDNTRELKIADPAGLLKWLAKDRALVTLTTGSPAERKALAALVKAWIRYM